MRNRLLTRLAAVVLAGAVLQLLLPYLSNRAGLVVACLPIAVAGFYALRGFGRQARAHSGRYRIGLILGAVAGGLLGVSYLTYTLDALTGSNPLVDRAADLTGVAAALVALPAILIGVPAAPSRLARATYAIDVITVAGALFAAAWQYILEPAAVSLAPAERTFFVVTMLPEVIAVGLALMVMSRADAGRYRSMRVLAGGLGAFTLAAIITVHNQTHDLTWYANGLGAVYFIAGLTIALASDETLTVDDDATGRHSFSGTWSTLPLLPVIVGLGAVAVPYLRTGTLSPVLVWTLLCTSVLAVLRQFLNLLVVKGLLTDLEEQRRRLDHQAHHDPLTGLPNRAAFHADARTALAAATPGRHTAVLMLDLDGFKEVNDTLGHAAGDALLVAVGERITAALPAGGRAARLGGDEFAVVLPALTDPAGALTAGDRILAALEPPVPVGGTDLRARCSIGVSTATGPGHDLDHLLHEADLALYAAKAAGKGVTRAYQPV